MVIGTSQSMRMPSRVSLRCWWVLRRASAPIRASPPSDDMRVLPNSWPDLTRPSTSCCNVRLEMWMPGTRLGVTQLAPFRATFTALHARHLFQHRADRRGVLVVVAALARLRVDRAGSIEHRRRHADVAGIAAYDIHVLLPNRNLHGRIVVTILHHHRPAQFENARIAGAGLDEVED